MAKRGGAIHVVTNTRIRFIGLSFLEEATVRTAK
jgi:hypothetical protein